MALRVCPQPRKSLPLLLPFLMLGLAFLCGQVRGVCERRIPDCYGDGCVEKVECQNGLCGDDGSCECFPCYSGLACDAYDDKYGPRFAIPEDTVIIEAQHTGVVYKAVAEDEDLGLTCPLGPGQHTRCPCAAITYKLLPPPDAPGHPFFTIHESSGQVFLLEGVLLDPGSTYTLEIVAFSTNDSRRHDSQRLTVLVHSTDPLQDLLQQESDVARLDEQTEKWKMDGYNSSQFVISENNYEASMNDLIFEEPESLTRKKRYSVGSDNDYDSLNITMSRVGASPPAELRVGTTINYVTTILLPTISIPMQLLVEVFSMDPISGNTAFALCDLEVSSIGGLIQTDGGLTLSPDQVKLVTTKSEKYDNVIDRAYFDFGNVVNADQYMADQTDYADSTITISFSATLIPNTDYTNDTATVTIGAQYDDDNYIFVGTDKMNYNMALDTYTPKITLDAPTDVAQYGGATFVLDAYINHPFDELLLQVYGTTPTDLDTFSISNVGVISIGSNFACSQFWPVTYFPSTTHRTNVMAEYKAKLITKNIIYPLGTDHHDNSDYLMRFYFNVFAVESNVGDTIDVNIGLVLGLTSVFQQTATLTVTAGVVPPAPSGTAVWSAVTPVTPIDVPMDQVVTWAATVTLSSLANIEMACTLVANAGNRACGIAYGNVGANIANLPDLSQHLVFDTDASAAFTLFYNSTGKVADAGANDIEFEFSVTVSTAPAGATITCSSGLSQVVAATMITTNETKELHAWMTSLTPDDTVWYEGSQAGVVMGMDFPAGGTPYLNLLVEAVTDLEEATWGGRTCLARVVSAGRGVPCVAGRKAIINSNTLPINALQGRVFNDTMQLPLGPACGAQRSGTDSDHEVFVEIYFDMPAGQTGTTDGAYNISAGISMDDRIIWTSWMGLTLSTATPSYDAAMAPTFAFLTNSIPTGDVEPGVPIILKLMLRTKPGSVMHYTIDISTDDPAILSLCRILFLAVGDNFPCLDPYPYGKARQEFQPTTVLHVPDWGLKATIDLGILKNIGNGSYVDGIIADENAIVLGIMVRGGDVGTATLTAQLNAAGTLTPITQAISVGSTLTTALSFISFTTTDTTEAYEGVMKTVDYQLVIPAGYRNRLKFFITNDDPANINLCFAAAVDVYRNTPCLILHRTASNMTEDTPTRQVYEVDVKEMCHYPIDEDPFFNQFTVRFGVMFLPGTSATSATMTIVVQESGVDFSPYTLTLTKMTTPYSPSVTSISGMSLSPLTSTIETVTPGMQLWTGVVLTVPSKVTTAVEFAVMTSSDGGRAYATVHDFRIPPEGTGTNIGCILADNSMYSRVLSQNTSVNVPMIHESQTDTLLVDLMYLTNTGVTHLQRNAADEDDKVSFEALIMIADHPNTTTGDIITVSFAIKTAEGIYVTNQTFTLDKTATQVTLAKTELLLTDNTTTTFSHGETVPLTLRVYHVLNESSQELNDACVRVLMPKYLKFVDTVDTFLSNITGTLTVSAYVDYCIQHLFFTDNLEANFTLSVDPEKELPLGLGVSKATTLLRLLGSTTSDTTIKYFGSTSFVVYEVSAEDVFDPLSLATLLPCQLSASAAMDASTLPAMALPGSGGGWSPPVIVGASWNQYLTIDFLRKTRVTKIAFQEVTGKLSIKTFQLQFSQSGLSFSGTCQLEVPTTGEVNLPRECLFEARFFRILVLTVSSGLGGTVASQETTALGVRFLEWYGAYQDENIATCTTNYMTRVSDNPSQWRSVAYDATNAIIYICDATFRREVKGVELACFSSPDGTAWAALPSYVGRLVGYDAARGMMCAMDKRGESLVCSTDGKTWSLMPNADHAAILSSATPPIAVPGLPSGQLTPVTLDGGWSADFTGVAKDGTHYAKWANCCT